MTRASSITSSFFDSRQIASALESWNQRFSTSAASRARRNSVSRVPGSRLNTVGAS